MPLAEENLASASPDLLHAMNKTFADALMSASSSTAAPTPDHCAGRVPPSPAAQQSRGSFSRSRLRPPPAPRTRPDISPESSSAAPRETVSCNTPAARATTRIPPRPSALASAPSTRRRRRSSRCGSDLANLSTRHGSCSSGVCAGRRLVGSGAGTGTATLIMNVCDDVSGPGGRGGHDSPGCVGPGVPGGDGCYRGLLRAA